MELYQLRQCVELTLEVVDRHSAIAAAEVYASWEEEQSAPVQHHTARPDTPVPFPHTRTHSGLGLRVLVPDGQGYKVGFYSDTAELSYDSMISLVEGALSRAMAEPVCPLLPQPVPIPAPPVRLYDHEVFSLTEDDVVYMANEALNGALTALQDSGYDQEVRVSGEVCSRKTLVVVGNTQGLLADDTATGLVATVHSRLMVEECWGSSSNGSALLNNFSAYEAGVEAASQALQMRGALAMPAGDYAVVLGPQAVAALLYDLWFPALSLDTVAHDASPLSQFQGQCIMSPLLSLADEARLSGMLGSRAMTDEGLPTGTTSLIERGRLVNFLADVYHAYACAPRFGPCIPRNGLRCAIDGRRFAMRSGIFPTNLTLTGSETMSLEALLAPISQGIYVGNLWATTPRTTLQTGAFTSTVIGSSFRIEQGKLSHPIQPGTLQLQDNFLELFQRCTGVATATQPVVLPTRQSAVSAPDLRCSLAHFV